MNIQRLTVYEAYFPLKVPFEVAYERYEAMASVIVKIETDAGFTGFGEGVPDEHVTKETISSTYAHLLHIGPALIGLTIEQSMCFQQTLDELCFHTPTVRAALEMACLDVLGKQMNKPVYELLGGAHVMELTIPHVIGIGSPEEMAADAHNAVKRGYTVFKMKAGGDGQDTERIEAVRKAVGKHSVRVDANQSWQDATYTAGFYDVLQRCEISLLEQPTHMQDIPALQTVARQCPIPVMADEAICDAASLENFLADSQLDYVNVKLMKCGGLFKAKEIVKLAKAHDVKCIVGSMIEAGIATSAGIHLALAMDNIVDNEMGAPQLFAEDVCSLPYKGEHLVWHDQPGLGIEVDEKKLENLSKQITVIS